MTNVEACKKIRKMLCSQYRRAFGGNLEESLANRNQELWLLGIDTKSESFVDICGTISPENLAIINSKGFYDADAGYRVNAQDALGLGGASVDIFLINTEHYNANPDFIEPIVVHELAHLLEQAGHMPQPQFNDEANAKAILKSLHPDILNPNL